MARIFSLIAFFMCIASARIVSHHSILNEDTPVKVLIACFHCVGDGQAEQETIALELA